MTDTERPPEPEPITEKYQADIDFDEYDQKELDPPDWITDLDREILALLGNFRLIMTPAIIAKNIDRSRSSVSRRLSTLEAGGMVEKVDRGHYRISGEGYARMVEKITTDEWGDFEGTWTTHKIPSPEEIKKIQEKENTREK